MQHTSSQPLIHKILGDLAAFGEHLVMSGQENLWLRHDFLNDARGQVKGVTSSNTS